MRYQDISGKEIIDINTGSRLGMLGQTDLQINEHTGQIEAIIIPDYKWFGFKKEDTKISITWEMVRKIGKDIILVEYDEEKQALQYMVLVEKIHWHLFLA